eukprot:6212538-Pleurochrysis_carterae.AAC.2
MRAVRRCDRRRRAFSGWSRFIKTPGQNVLGSRIDRRRCPRFLLSRRSDRSRGVCEGVGGGVCEGGSAACGGVRGGLRDHVCVDVHCGVLILCVVVCMVVCMAVRNQPAAFWRTPHFGNYESLALTMALISRDNSAHASVSKVSSMFSADFSDAHCRALPSPDVSVVCSSLVCGARCAKCAQWLVRKLFERSART